MLRQRLVYKDFHTPVSSATGSGYTSLCTVLQAFPLGVLVTLLVRDEVYGKALWAFDHNDFRNFPFDIALQSFVVIAMNAVIWHRYVTEDNFVPWFLGPLDTIIPYVFAILQTFLTVAILASHAWWFSLWLTTIAAWGMAAYTNILNRLSEPFSQRLLIEHFSRRPPTDTCVTTLGYAVHEKLVRHCRFTLIELACATLCFVMLTVFCFVDALGINNHVKVKFVCITASVFVALVFATDVNKSLSRLWSTKITLRDRLYSTE